MEVLMFALKVIGFFLSIWLTIRLAVLVSDEIETHRLMKLDGKFVPAYWPEESFWQLHKRLYPEQAKYYVAVNRSAKRFHKIGDSK